MKALYNGGVLIDFGIYERGGGQLESVCRVSVLKGYNEETEFVMNTLRKKQEKK